MIAYSFSSVRCLFFVSHSVNYIIVQKEEALCTPDLLSKSTPATSPSVYFTSTSSHRYTHYLILCSVLLYKPAESPPQPRFVSFPLIAILPPRLALILPPLAIARILSSRSFHILNLLF
jgi:hypothetical protein